MPAPNDTFGAKPTSPRSLARKISEKQWRMSLARKDCRSSGSRSALSSRARTCATSLHRGGDPGSEVDGCSRRPVRAERADDDGDDVRPVDEVAALASVLENVLLRAAVETRLMPRSRHVMCKFNVVVRVLILATYFPRPGNPLIGRWALQQAQALQREVEAVVVVSPSSWVPTAMLNLPTTRRHAHRLQTWTQTPQLHVWDGLPVHYPRWAFYNLHQFSRAIYRSPSIQMFPAWWTIRSRLISFARAWNPDILLAHHSDRSGFIARQLSRRLAVPYVTADYSFEEIADCARYPSRHAVLRRVAEDAAASVVASKRMELEFSEQFPLSRPHTVHHGTPPIPLSIIQRPRPSELRGRKVVLTAGWFVRRKEFPAVIKAFARVAEHHSDSVLRVIGDGKDRKRVEAAIHELRLGDRVELLGSQAHERVIQEMVWADVFVSPGHNEPFATVFLEALAAATPIVWGKDGGIGDVACSGVHGYAVAPGSVSETASALHDLLGDDQKRLRMAFAAKLLHTEYLSWDRHAEQLERVLRVAAGRGAGLGV